MKPYRLPRKAVPRPEDCPDAKPGPHGTKQPCSCSRGCACPWCGCGDPHLAHVRRLPVYGERAIDFHLRKLRETWTFGHWLHEDFDEYEELLHAIDAHEDPYTVDIKSVEGYFADPTSELVDEREGPHDLRPSFKQAKDAFLTEKLGELLSRRVSETELAHRCFSRFPEPIDKWPTECGVYYARAATTSFVKIGHGKDISKRVREWMTGTPFPVELLAWEPGPKALESQRHVQFGEWRQKPQPGVVRGREWFRLDGAVVEHIRALRSAQTGGDERGPR